jgi:hypothetical protein
MDHAAVCSTKMNATALEAGEGKVHEAWAEITRLSLGISGQSIYVSATRLRDAIRYWTDTTGSDSGRKLVPSRTMHIARIRIAKTKPVVSPMPLSSSVSRTCQKCTNSFPGNTRLGSRSSKTRSNVQHNFAEDEQRLRIVPPSVSILCGLLDQSVSIEPPPR